ncbi:Fc.00g080000.m01.CDS01 [Cosmosporella sp. VM-42]
MSHATLTPAVEFQHAESQPRSARSRKRTPDQHLPSRHWGGECGEWLTWADRPDFAMGVVVLKKRDPAAAEGYKVLSILTTDYRDYNHQQATFTNT